MKKFVCLLLSALMILSSASALAATKELGAYEDLYATNIYVEGKSDLEGQAVTILLKNGDNVGYISEIETESDGTYKYKFKFKNDISGYNIKVRDSETSADITDTLTTAIAQKEVYSVDIDLNVNGNDVIKYASEGDILNIVADIENKYADNKKVTVMLAAYDENNKLLATDIKTLQIGFGDIEAKKVVEFSDVTFPAEAAKAKAFAWQDAVNLIPLTKQQTMLAYGDSRLFENRHEDQDDTWVVGLVGASTVQAGAYQLFLDQYYATRHPDKNIVIVNKGCPGYTAKDIYTRLDWDIFNENDILGYGACDEIVIMVGANDLQYSTYANGKMDDDEYVSFYNGENVYTNHYNPSKNGTKVSNMTALVEDSFSWYTKVVEECKIRGKAVAFTPMTLYDDSEEFTHILYDYGNVYGFNQALGMLSDKLEEYAREQEEAGFPITFLDTWGMSDEYTDMIRSTTDVEIKNYYMTRKDKEGYVFLGQDGLHHSTEGGYLVGYIIARGQETDPIVASVEIDALTNSVTAEDATVTDLTASSTGVSYTYAPKALPMYVGAPGYTHGEKLGLDLTGNINKEIIKVEGLADGTFSIVMDGVEVTKATAEQLAVGVNIATLEKNPGQVKAKDIFTFDAEKWGSDKDASGNFIANEYKDGGRRLNEIHLRQIATQELAVRIANERKNKVDQNDPMYETFTVDDWCDLAYELGDKSENIETYRERKINEQNFADKVKANIVGTKARSNLDEYSVNVVISKVQ